MLVWEEFSIGEAPRWRLAINCSGGDWRHLLKIVTEKNEREKFCFLVMADGYKILSKFGTIGRSSKFLKY